MNAASAERRSPFGAAARVVAFILLFLVFQVAASALLASPLTWVMAELGQRTRIDEWVMLVASLAATAAMLASIDKRPWSDVGLARPAARPRTLFESFLLGAATIGVASACLMAIGWLRIVPAEQGSWLPAAIRVSVFLFPAALFEEVVCRGYLLTATRDAIGTRGAVALTSVMFGLLHVLNPGATVESVILVTLAGVFLAAIRVAFDSLFAAWLAHFAWNWVMAVPLHAAVSGTRFESPDYRMVSDGPGWITGGGWGPEGGLAAGLGMLAGLGYLYARRRREES